MNLYEILGVQETANQSEIKSAYHKLSFKYHPDATHSNQFVEEFKKITNAYDTLSDLSKRANYDKALHPRPLKNQLKKIYKPEERTAFIYKNDPNLGKVFTPEPPRFDIWGRRLSSKERENWKRNAESEAGQFTYKSKQTEPEFQFNRNEFKDTFDGTYESDAMPKIR